MPEQLPDPPKSVPAAFLSIGKFLRGIWAWARQWDRMTVGRGLVLTRAKEGHRLALVPEQVAEVLSGTGAGGLNRFITFTFTAAGDVPTDAEIQLGIEAAYSSTSPRTGDFLVSDAFHYIVTSANLTANGIWRIQFQSSGITYVALNVGPNRLY